jgi:hypothetical protein
MGGFRFRAFCLCIEREYEVQGSPDACEQEKESHKELPEDFSGVIRVEHARLFLKLYLYVGTLRFEQCLEKFLPSLALGKGDIWFVFRIM